jgi:hypothetical protein
MSMEEPLLEEKIFAYSLSPNGKPSRRWTE